LSAQVDRLITFALAGKTVIKLWLFSSASLDLITQNTFNGSMLQIID
jgi:hypothetical protein